MLTIAWFKRKRFEAHIQAVEIISALGKTMGGSAQNDARMGGNDAVMQQLGVTF